MALTKEEIYRRLLEAKGGNDFYNLYEIVFGEEVPLMNELDSSVVITKIMYAIDENKKIEPFILEDDMDI
tara:strand:- start:80 stop:289 length:210 start_codon:yes stop_codon:yes gene_type:complete